MAVSKPENQGNHADQANIVETTRALVDALPSAPGLEASIREGREIAAIVASLGLPDDVVAAVHVYPLVRDDFIDENFNNNNSFK